MHHRSMSNRFDEKKDLNALYKCKTQAMSNNDNSNDLPKTILLLGVFVAVRGGTALMNSGSWFGAFTRGFVKKAKLGELFA
ncbi:MAG TPA: hypothetical protein ACN46Y_05955 [Prochlorococcus sp.]